MKTFRKILLSLGVSSALLLGGIATVHGAGSGDLNSYSYNMFGENSTTANIGIDTIGTSTDQKGSIIQVIKNAVNWVLGMLSLVALVLCLWGGFQIVTAAGDESKQKKGMSVLKHAAIGLVIIGLAWFIVTIIFWLLRGVTGASGNNGVSANASGT